jgi:hypothetical protein
MPVRDALAQFLRQLFLLDSQPKFLAVSKSRATIERTSAPGFRWWPARRLS